MKPRKPDEPDAAYIARLETANSNLRKRNAELSDQNGKFITHGASAASQAGAWLRAAAEVCGSSDDVTVTSALGTLDALAGLPWSEIPETVSTLDLIYPGKPALSGDAEMIVRSAYEVTMQVAEDPFLRLHVLQKTPAKDREFFLELIYRLTELARANVAHQVKAATGCDFMRAPIAFPKIETLSGAREVIECAWHEVADVLSDVQFSQALLRLDLRANMYDTAFRRIADIMRSAAGSAEGLPAAEMLDAMPW